MNRSELASRGAQVDAASVGPGNQVRTAVTPDGTCTYELNPSGFVVENRVYREGGATEIWRFDWDFDGRLIGVERPDGSRWKYEYGTFPVPSRPSIPTVWRRPSAGDPGTITAATMTAGTRTCGATEASPTVPRRVTPPTPTVRMAAERSHRLVGGTIQIQVESASRSCEGRTPTLAIRPSSAGRVEATIPPIPTCRRAGKLREARWGTGRMLRFRP